MHNLFDISGKIALVTGGSRGIGAMIAEGFVKNGVKTYITSRKSEQCNHKAKELSKFGECISVPTDLTDMKELDKLVNNIKKNEKKLNILINNAGAAWGAPFDTFPENGWDKVMDTNIKAVFFLIQKLIKILENSGNNEDPSRIINIGSIDGIGIPDDMAGTSIFLSSKASAYITGSIIPVDGGSLIARRHME